MRRRVDPCARHQLGLEPLRRANGRDTRGRAHELLGGREQRIHVTAGAAASEHKD